MRDTIDMAREQETQEIRDAFDAVCRGRVEAAVKAEREACAKFCETNQVWVGKGKRGFSEWGEDDFVTGGIHQGMDYAAAIRARGETK